MNPSKLISVDLQAKRNLPLLLLLGQGFVEPAWKLPKWRKKKFEKPVKLQERESWSSVEHIVRQVVYR